MIRKIVNWYPHWRAGFAILPGLAEPSGGIRGRRAHLPRPTYLVAAYKERDRDPKFGSWSRSCHLS